MTRRVLVFATMASGLLVAGCAEEGPVQTVSDSTMVNVLVDLHLAGARERLGTDVPPGLRDTVLFRYGLDSASFQRGMAWYEAHPERYVALYGTVVDQLNAERTP